MTIVQKPVKNYTPGRFGYKPEAIVIHIAEGTLEGGHSWFNNPSSQVSSHYMVGKNGAIWQFVKDEDTAWHAGGVANPNWSLLKGGVNPNFYTIGIEHEGFTGQGWTDAMYNATSELIATLCLKFDIPLDRNHIIGHYQINSLGRQNCPGNGMSFDRLINTAFNYYEDPQVIKELQDKITRQNNIINEFKSQVSNLQAENKSLRDTIIELEKVDNSTDIIQLKSNNIKLIKEVKRLQLSESTLTKEIQNLKNQVNELKKKSRR